MALNLKDLRTETLQELENQLRTVKGKLLDMKFQHATGALTNPLQVREARRDIARIMTAIKEKEEK